LSLLAAEGFTIVSIGSLLRPHVFIGLILVPPVLLKIGSTTYRFAQYYRAKPAYRRKGPPHVLLRLLGPLLVGLTVILFASGIALLFVGSSLRDNFLLLHKASFVAWFGAMAIHVLSHIVEAVHTAPQDYLRRGRTRVLESLARQLLIAASVVLGVVIAVALTGRVTHFLAL
jgi:hypothetical protein